MAYECIYDFIEQCLARTNEFNAKSKKEYFKECRKTEIIWECLYDYYKTVLAHPKFKGQRQHCLMVLFRLNYLETKYITKKMRMKIPTKTEIADYFQIPMNQIL